MNIEWHSYPWSQSNQGGSDPVWHRWVAAPLIPILMVWTLPQTLAGFVIMIVRKCQGYPTAFYRFGPFIFLVVPSGVPNARGISLGQVIFAQDPGILRHEFCHMFSGLWLSWLYLPVYGLEYLIMGHSRSFHERITCRLEHSVPWAWRRISKIKMKSHS